MQPLFRHLRMSWWRDNVLNSQLHQGHLQYGGVWSCTCAMMLATQFAYRYSIVHCKLLYVFGIQYTRTHTRAISFSSIFLVLALGHLALFLPHNAELNGSPLLLLHLRCHCHNLFLHVSTFYILHSTLHIFLDDVLCCVRTASAVTVMRPCHKRAIRPYTNNLITNTMLSSIFRWEK